VNDTAPFRPGLVQAAARGWRTDVDAFMGTLTGPRGLTGWRNALTVISNHDEVGNAQRTVDVADGDSPTLLPPPYARDLARFTAGIGLASPGVPIFFMGDESMAKNEFKWGNPATWDLGWDWEAADPNRDLSRLPPAEREKAELAIARKRTFEFYKEALALRKSSPAFDADAEVARVYTHNDDSVLAFARRKAGEEFVVVGSLNRRNLGGYRIPLPPGQWKEVLNSDGAAFGGSNFGNGGGTFGGGGGSTPLNIPSGGYVVLKKVG